MFHVFTSSRPPIPRQLDEHPHPHRQRLVAEVVPVAVQRRVAGGVLRLDADEEEAARALLEGVGEVLAAHGGGGGGGGRGGAPPLPWGGGGGGPPCGGGGCWG